jgi:hypothetical protein
MSVTVGRVWTTPPQSNNRRCFGVGDVNALTVVEYEDGITFLGDTIKSQYQAVRNSAINDVNAVPTTTNNGI